MSNSISVPILKIGKKKSLISKELFHGAQGGTRLQNYFLALLARDSSVFSILVPVSDAGHLLSTDTVRTELMKSEVIPYIPNLRAWAENV